MTALAHSTLAQQADQARSSPMADAGIRCPYCDGSGVLADEAAHVGARILFHRKALSMTQNDLAGKVGKSRPQIANIECGRSDISVSTLALFAKALNVKPSELVP